jgi:voltage-gated potassium channel
MLFKHQFMRVWTRARERAWFGTGLLAGALVLCIVGNAVTYSYFDGADFGDALWYSVISITTIGYGDFSAESLGARLGTVIFIVICGLGTFSLVLGLIFDRLTEQFEKGKRGMNDIISHDHVLIIHFPSRARVRDLIGELRNDPVYSKRDIVIVADGLHEHPMPLERVYFVSGNPVEEDVLIRAGLERANAAIVLATGESESSDAVVASTVSVIEHLRSDVYTVAECVNGSHRHLFRVNDADAVVCTNRLVNNLLVQEMQDHGVADTIEMITSNQHGTTVYTTEVSGLAGEDYQALAKSLLDQDANLLAVKRGPDTHTTFKGLSAASGDKVVYVGHQRYDWPALTRLAQC